MLSCTALLWTPLAGVGKADLILGSSKDLLEATSIYLRTA